MLQIEAFKEHMLFKNQKLAIICLLYKTPFGREALAKK